MTIPRLVILRLRRRSSQAVLRHARLPLPLRVPLPIRLRARLQLLRLLHNPPPLVGFCLALLPLSHVMTRRPVVVSQSRMLVTLPPLGWLTSFIRSALTLALSSTRRLRGAVSKPGLVSQRLRPQSSASDCTLAWLRYRRRWLLGQSLWLAALSLCHGWSLRLRARTLWRMTLCSRLRNRSTLPLPSLPAPEFWLPGVGVRCRFPTWNASNACSKVSWRWRLRPSGWCLAYWLCLRKTDFSHLARLFSTRLFLQSLLPCHARPVLLLRALTLFVPGVGRACSRIPLSRFQNPRSAPWLHLLGRLLGCLTRGSSLRWSPRSIVPRKSPVTWRFRAPCVEVGQLLPLRLLRLLDHAFLPFLVAGRTGSAPLPPLVLGVVSASGVVRGGGLLLLDLRVSGGRSHLLSGPFPAVVCPSIGRPGGTGVRSLGL